MEFKIKKWFGREKKGMDLADKLFLQKIHNKSTDNMNIGTLSDSQKKAYYHGLISTCFDLRAESLSQAEICLYKYDSQKKLIPLEWHPFLDVLRTSNRDYIDLCFPEILEYTSKSLDIFGNAYWCFNFGGEDLPAELTVIPADEMKVEEVNQFGNPTKYLRTINVEGKNHKLIYDAKYIVPFKTYNPNSAYYGLGIIQKSLIHLGINNQASKYQYDVLKKNGIPRVVMEQTDGTNAMDDEAMLEVYNQRYAGSNSGTIPILPPGYKLNKLSLSPVDMDIIALKEFSKTEILDMCRVPASALGSGDSTNKSTAAVNMVTFNHNVIKPILKKMAGVLSMYLYKTYGEDIVVEFTLPLPSDPETTNKQFETLGNLAKDAKENEYSRRILEKYMNVLKIPLKD